MGGSTNGLEDAAKGLLAMTIMIGYASKVSVDLLGVE